MLDIRNDMYKVGLIGGIVLLYAASAYSYLSSTGDRQTSGEYLATPSTDKTMIRVLETARAHGDHKIPHKSLQSANVIVPGSTCVITSENLDFSGDFVEVSADCFAVGSSQEAE